MFCATRPYTDSAMPRKSPASERPTSDSETMGQRLARLRKERSWTQVELSDYERGKLRLNADMIVRFAQALDVTTDELLQPKAEPSALRRKPSLRVLRRLERIEKLPAHQQNTLLKTIDGFLKGVAS